MKNFFNKEGRKEYKRIISDEHINEMKNKSEFTNAEKKEINKNAHKLLKIADKIIKKAHKKEACAQKLSIKEEKNKKKALKAKMLHKGKGLNFANKKLNNTYGSNNSSEFAFMQNNVKKNDDKNIAKQNENIYPNAQMDNKNNELNNEKNSEIFANNANIVNNAQNDAQEMGSISDEKINEYLKKINAGEKLNLNDKKQVNKINENAHKLIKKADKIIDIEQRKQNKATNIAAFSNLDNGKINKIGQANKTKKAKLTKEEKVERLNKFKSGFKTKVINIRTGIVAIIILIMAIISTISVNEYNKVAPETKLRKRHKCKIL